MTAAPLLRADNVTKRFTAGGSLFAKTREIKAVDQASFTVEKGENVVLLGESGCGKSTLGKLTLGLLRPDSGRIEYEGKDIWSLEGEQFADFRRNAQIVHQDPYTSLNPVRTIYQSLAPAMIRNKMVSAKEAYNRVRDLLPLVGLVPPEDFLDRYPSRMSGGQMQRVTLARAISLRPKYIVADEAVSMLDASLRLGAVDLMLDLQKQFGMSYLFITHDFGVSRYFIKKSRGKMMVMYLGSLIEIGDGDSVIQNPTHPYTQILKESIPVPDPKVAREKPVPKLRSLEIPRLEETPSGCKFHTRCPYAVEICSTEVPLLREVKQKLVACHLAEQFL
jgi:oligopeptide/dipeptide ABC transporter ATP-binding protein